MTLAYAPAGADQSAGLHKRHHRLHIWSGAGGVVFIFMVLLIIIGQFSQPPSSCRRSCGPSPPPTSPPLSSSNVYTSSRYGFRLTYDRRYAGTPNAKSNGLIGWEFPLKSGGYLEAKVEGARNVGTSPQDVVNSVLAKQGYSQFRPVYALPMPEVGYRPGAGEVYQGVWSPLSGQSETERLVVVAAIKKSLAVALICEAPKVADHGDHPNPAELGIGADQFCDNLLNAVVWPGQPSH